LIFGLKRIAVPAALYVWAIQPGNGSAICIYIISNEQE
jgi:hypothetical protein